MVSALKHMTNKSMTQTTLLFDLESTGLLRRGSQLHCIVARDTNAIDEPIVWDAPRGNLNEGVEQLKRADFLIGHNIAGFDVPLIKELYDFKPQGIIKHQTQTAHHTPNITDSEHRTYLWRNQMLERVAAPLQTLFSNEWEVISES